MLASLTRRQKQILDYISSYQQMHHIAPSLIEIREHFHLRAVSTVHEHIEKLKEKGYLRKEMNQPRGIRTTSQAQQVIEVDVLGYIAAGEPIEAIEDAEPLQVGVGLIPSTGRHYALRVRGESMINEGIMDGDIVIVRHQSDAVDGDRVVAIVEDNKATLKTFYRMPDRIKLQPANDNLEPRYYTDIEIRGKVVALLRRY